jgi:hypothetical protein
MIDYNIVDLITLMGSIIIAIIYVVVILFKGNNR